MSTSTRGKTFGQMIRATAPLVTRFCAGFDDSNRTSQAPGLPNHAAWTLGHLALTMHRFAERFDGQPLPASDFITGDGTSGTTERYDTESVCFGSTPINDPAKYPSMERAERVFASAIERLAAALESLSDERFDEEQPWGSGRFTVQDLAVRVAFHNGTHAGQLTDLRRALGLPRVIG